MSKYNYDKYPKTNISGFDNEAFQSYSEIINQLRKEMTLKKNILTIDCSDGVYESELIENIKHIGFDLIINSKAIFITSNEMDKKLYRYLTDDRVFGIAYTGKWLDFVDKQKLNAIKEKVNKADGNVLIVGLGASYINPGTITVYADMTIWELQMRYRNRSLPNFNSENYDDEVSKKFKRGYFVDWRLTNRHKIDLLNEMDYYLETVQEKNPKMITKTAFDQGLLQLLNQPFRTVPFFDEGLWGGNWMINNLGVDKKGLKNTAWSYNCLFPENEVALQYGNCVINIPGYTLCQKYPKQLIGEKGFSRFGSDYPIRFDFLDTFGGGPLSLQVHPDTKYFQENFGMPFTQDESYYFLDCASEDTYMYLGLTNSCDKDDMIQALRKAEKGEISFPAEKYSNKVQVRKHEHYSIPAGIVHCSGENTLVLEISTSPCIFTFKLWDWDRIGLNGLPRPINIERGVDVIQWDKKADWIKETCFHNPIVVSEGNGFRHEKTGLHFTQFIETHRYWQSVKTLHKTGNETNVINLIHGKEALIESPTNQFTPFKINFAETVVIPSLIEEYTIRPIGLSIKQEIGIIKAFVKF